MHCLAQQQSKTNDVRIFLPICRKQNHDNVRKYINLISKYCIRNEEEVSIATVLWCIWLYTPQGKIHKCKKFSRTKDHKTKLN